MKGLRLFFAFWAVLLIIFQGVDLYFEPDRLILNSSKKRPEWLIPKMGIWVGTLISVYSYLILDAIDYFKKTE